MRVLHLVASGDRRGAEIFAADLAGSLAKAAVVQRIAMLRSPVGQAVRYPVETTVLGNGGRRLPGVGVETATVGRLRATVKGWAPDVIQAHGGEALKYAVAATTLRLVPVVYRRIGSAPPWITRGVRRTAYARLLRRAALVVAVAEAVRLETLQLFRLPADDVVTIPNGVDAHRLEPSADRAAVRRRLGIPPDVRVVLSLGALTWEKDPVGHLRVTAPVLAQRARAVHLFAGDGPLRGDLEAAVRQKGLGDSVFVLGGRSDVADLLTAADLLLFASRPGGMEGMPAIVIEAGMAGLPVAGYAISGVAEVVASGETGLLVAPMAQERLTQAVATLLEDDPLRGRMGQAARVRCAARYEIGAVAPQYLRRYEQVAQRK
jgi:glycosyltransferase involved in cell wall biosynthesis